VKTTPAIPTTSARARLTRTESRGKAKREDEANRKGNGRELEMLPEPAVNRADVVADPAPIDHVPAPVSVAIACGAS